MSQNDPMPEQAKGMQFPRQNPQEKKDLSKEVGREYGEMYCMTNWCHSETDGPKPKGTWVDHWLLWEVVPTSTSSDSHEAEPVLRYNPVQAYNHNYSRRRKGWSQVQGLFGLLSKFKGIQINLVESCLSHSMLRTETTKAEVLLEKRMGKGLERAGFPPWLESLPALHPPLDSIRN